MNIKDSYIHGADGKGVVKSLYFSAGDESVYDLSGQAYTTHATDLVMILADGALSKIAVPLPTFNLNTLGYASSVMTVTSTSANNHYLTFVDSNNVTADAELIYTHANLYYKPSTSTLNVPNLVVSTSTTGFNFSGIGAATLSQARVVWFSHASLTGTPVYHSSFTYNPGTSTLSVANITGTNIAITIGNTRVALGGTYTPDTVINSSSTNNTLPSSKAVWDAIASGMAANDAMVFKGLLTGGADAANTTYTPAADKGHTYKVGTAGYINGTYHNVNDTFICQEDSTAAAAASNVSTISGKWCIVEGNGDYLSIYGGVEHGLVTFDTGGNAMDSDKGINFGTVAHIGGSTLLGLYSTGDIALRPGLTDLTTTSTNGVVIGSTTITYNGGLMAHAGNIVVPATVPTIGTSNTLLATIAGIEIKAKIGSYAASSHTHSVKINGSTKTIAAPGGTAVDLGSYLPLAGGTMTGAIKRYYNAVSNDPMIALTSNNKDIWLWRINSGTSAGVNVSGVRGFGLKYLGTGTDNNDDLVLYADNQTGTQVAAITVKQDGKVIFAGAPTAAGFIKSDSDDTYVLLGGGGHKLISDFVTVAQVTQSEVPVVLQNFNTEYTIATIAGVDIKVKTPVNPNTDNTAAKLGTAGATTAASGATVSASSSTGLIFQGGTGAFKVGDGTTSFTVSVGHGLSTKNMKINGTNYALYTSASSLPTFFAPTGLGTGGYILATNSAGTALEWVAKPAANVTTSAVVASSASGTSLISANTANPFYNLIEGSTVTRSIQFQSGDGISISASSSGVITFSSTLDVTGFYWANLPVLSAASNTTNPIFGTVTIGGCTLSYDSTNLCLKFTFA